MKCTEIEWTRRDATGDTQSYRERRGLFLISNYKIDTLHRIVLHLIVAKHLLLIRDGRKLGFLESDGVSE